MAVSARHWRDSIRPFFTVVVVYCALVWTAILQDSHQGSEAYDQDHHHIVVVEQIAASLRGDGGALPLRDLIHDYPSATGPAYHAALAFARVCGVESLTALQFLSSLAGLALVTTLFWQLASRMAGWEAAAWTAPLLLSPYFLAGSVWLTTDVAALALQVGVLAVLIRGALDARSLLVVAVLTTTAVLVRQPSIWLLAPIVARGLNDATILRGSWSRSARMAWGSALIIPGISLGALLFMWGGLVPPSFRAQHGAGANPATPAIFLALLGLWGSVWLVVFLARRGIGASRKLLAVGALLGVLLALAVPTDYSREAGRWGGPLWSVIHALPSVGGRSILVLMLAAVGGTVLAALLHRAVHSVEGRVLGVALVAFVAATTANTQCFERYLDLGILAFLPLLVLVGATEERLRPQPSLAFAPPVALALVQFGLSCAMLAPAFFGALNR